MKQILVSMDGQRLNQIKKKKLKAMEPFLLFLKGWYNMILLLPQNSVKNKENGEKVLKLLQSSKCVEQWLASS